MLASCVGTQLHVMLLFHFLFYFVDKTRCQVKTSDVLVIAPSIDPVPPSIFGGPQNHIGGKPPVSGYILGASRRKSLFSRQRRNADPMLGGPGT